MAFLPKSIVPVSHTLSTIPTNRYCVNSCCVALQHTISTQKQYITPQQLALYANSVIQIPTSLDPLLLLPLSKQALQQIVSNATSSCKRQNSLHCYGRNNGGRNKFIDMLEHVKGLREERHLEPREEQHLEQQHLKELSHSFSNKELRKKSGDHREQLLKNDHLIRENENLRRENMEKLVPIVKNLGIGLVLEGSIIYILANNHSQCLYCIYVCIPSCCCNAQICNRDDQKRAQRCNRLTCCCNGKAKKERKDNIRAQRYEKQPEKQPENAENERASKRVKL